MQDRQTLYIGIEKAQEAITSKARLEAFAFAIQIKMTFRDSIFRDATIRRCKSVFGLGSTKATRVRKNAVAFGYVKREGKNLIAQQVRTVGNYNYRYEEIPSHAKVLTADNSPLKVRYKLSYVEDVVREAVLLNHINKQTECSDTFRRAEDSNSHPQARKAAQKKLSRMCYTKEAKQTLSLDRMSQVINAKKYRSRKLISGLVKRKDVILIPNLIETSINPSEYTRTMARQYQEHGGKGFLTLAYGKVVIRVANTYRNNTNKITVR